MTTVNYTAYKNPAPGYAPSHILIDSIEGDLIDSLSQGQKFETDQISEFYEIRSALEGQGVNFVRTDKVLN